MCLVHLTRYLDLSLAAKRREVIFLGTTILFSNVYLMIRVSIITDHELAMYICCEPKQQSKVS